MSMSFSVVDEHGDPPKGRKAYDVDLNNAAAVKLIRMLNLDWDGISTAGEHNAADLLAKLAAFTPTPEQSRDFEQHGLKLADVLIWVRALAEEAVRFRITLVSWH